MIIIHYSLEFPYYFVKSTERNANDNNLSMFVLQLDQKLEIPAVELEQKEYHQVQLQLELHYKL